MDKTSHQVTLEPEGRDTAEIYAKGLGNCLPVELQLELFRSVRGLEEVEVMRPAYAIEYDYVDPLAASGHPGNQADQGPLPGRADQRHLGL
ncbi:MAG: FAD-dependent oxidoreductase [Deltaproteobacteria bacterium]|nr:FAD-dependent oxidoreductase [Deltaproteobacteria bacterium]